MKNLLLAGMAAVAAFGVSASAQAAGGVITLSELTPGSGNYTGAFSASHAGSFTDTWTFETVLPGFADASVINIAFNAAADIDFTAATLNGIPLHIVNSTTDPLSTAYTLTQVFSAGGTNTLILSGISGGSSSYSGTVNYSVSAVPEPATWAMMIGGFGIAGVAMRRRARRVAVSFA